MPQGDHWLPGFNFNAEEWFGGRALRNAGNLPLVRPPRSSRHLVQVPAALLDFRGTNQGVAAKHSD
jgi:hypothetical protein